MKKEDLYTKASICVLFLLTNTVLFYFLKAAQSVLLILVALLIFISFRKKIKIDFISLPFISCFFILVLTNLIYFDSNYTFKRIGESFLIFMVPVLLYLQPNFLLNKNKDWLLLNFSIATTFLCLFIISYYFYDLPNHLYNWYFARYNIMVFMKIHPTYLGLWIGTSILLLLNQLQNKYQSIKVLVVVIPLLCIHFASLILLNTRMAMYSIIIIILINVLFFINRKLKIIFGALFILFIIATATFTSRYREDIKFLIESKISDLPRYPMFDCSLILITKSPLTGIDPRVIQTKLNNLYLKKYPHAYKGLKDINSHNQFMDYFIKGGVIMFLSFIYMLCAKLKIAIQKRNFVYFSITLFFSFSFLTESVLVRQYGIFIYFLVDIFLFNSLFINQCHSANKIEEA